MKILGVSGSLRAASFNTTLLRAAQELAPEDVEIRIFGLHDLPLFNQDVEDQGDPAPFHTGIRTRRDLQEFQIYCFTAMPAIDGHQNRIGIGRRRVHRNFKLGQGPPGDSNLNAGGCRIFFQPVHGQRQKPIRRTNVDLRAREDQKPVPRRHLDPATCGRRRSWNPGLGHETRPGGGIDQ